LHVKTTGKTSKQFRTATETSHGFTKAGCDWQSVVNLPFWKIVFFFIHNIYVGGKSNSHILS